MDRVQAGRQKGGLCGADCVGREGGDQLAGRGPWGPAPKLWAVGSPAPSREISTATGSQPAE